MGHCGSGGDISKERKKCGSFVNCGNCGSLKVTVGQEMIVVRKEGSVGLLVNCGSFSQLWVIVGLLGKCGSVWVRRQ